MPYKFAVDQRNFEDFASGRVLYNQRGATAFPVRLASEIYQRCRAFLTAQGVPSGYSLYDPLCGGAYLLTALGFLHGDDLSRITGSDVDETVLELARRNLSLLNLAGLRRRVEEIDELWVRFGKASHFEAKQSALRLGALVKGRTPPEVDVFCADATQPTQLVGQIADAHIVITDLPYGNLVNWSQAGQSEPVEPFLSTLEPVLAKPSVVAITAPKGTKPDHPLYRRVQRFSIGKREITLLTPT